MYLFLYFSINIKAADNIAASSLFLSPFFRVAGYNNLYQQGVVININKGGIAMLNKKTIIGAVLFLSLFLAGQAFAGWHRTEINLWGVSGTAHCNNYENVSVRVETAYLDPNDALTVLWHRAAEACKFRGGLYDVSGQPYCQWRPYR
ncbi:MAG: hypothetical protein D3916_04480 [Candidatus Electrothrix sp. MAN1_4]|nr:hypothetical protein [Candidatus Electrothrix sp. MAN1_4]